MSPKVVIRFHGVPGGASKRKQASKRQIPKTFGALHGAAIMTGSMIGSGIFTNPGRIYGIYEYGLLCMVWWLVGAIIAYFGAMTYGEWACRLPKSGGDAHYLAKSFPKSGNLLSFMFSFCRSFLINPGYCVAAAIAFMEYFLYCFDRYRNISLGEAAAGESHNSKSLEYRLIQYFGGCTLLLIHGLFCAASNRISGIALKVFSFFAVLVVTLIAIMGVLLPLKALPHVPYAGMFEKKDPLPITVVDAVGNVTNEQPWWPPHLPKFASGILLSLWAFDGWSSLAMVAGDLKDPSKDIRKAVMMSSIFVGVIFFFSNIAFLYAVPHEKFGKDMPIQWGEIVIGKGLGRYIICAIVMLCTFSCAYSYTFSTSRILQGTAASGHLLFNSFLSHVSARTNTPINAILTNFVLCCIYMTPVLLPGDALTVIITIVSNNFWVFSTITSIALIKQRRAEGSIWRSSTMKNNSIEVWIGAPFILALTGFMLIITGFFNKNKGAPWYLQPYMLGVYSVAVLVISGVLSAFRKYLP